MKYVPDHGSAAVPTPSPHNGFWVRADTVYDVTESSHVLFIVGHPQLFALTLDEIRKVYADHQENLGSEGSAREALVRHGTSLGWIRIRKYVKPQEYISIQCWNTEKQRKEIVAFIEWAVELKVMRSDEAAVILGFQEEKDRHSFSWEDGGVGVFITTNR